MDFQNKVVVVTGGASGIGLACSREFAQRHATVAIVDLDVKAGRRAAKELHQSSGRVKFFSFDVSKGPQVASGVARIAKKLGGIDVLINNAGIQRYANAVTCTEEDWDLVLTVNPKSAFLMSKYAIPWMIKRGGGAIVNTGSVQSVAAQSNSVHYVTSKHGMLGLTRCLALDFAGKTSARTASCRGRLTLRCCDGRRHFRTTRKRSSRHATGFTCAAKWGSRKRWPASWLFWPVTWLPLSPARRLPSMAASWSRWGAWRFRKEACQLTGCEALSLARRGR